MITTPRRTLSRARTAFAGLLVVGSTLVLTATAATATTGTGTSTAGTTSGSGSSLTTSAPPPAPARVAPLGTRAVSIAASRRGSPYVYGASGPHRFDCSGLTMWTFARLGRHLPHSAAAQYGRVKHIRASDRRIGDLVFFHDGGGIYHVGIYAGHNEIWHAPYPGAVVRKERLWTGSVYYGRVR